MNSIILCEGKTDAILTSYYLDKTYGWKLLKGSKPVNLKVRDKQSEVMNWYELSNKKLCIWGVGGIDNFDYAINYIINLNRLANEEQVFNKLIIITDRDDEESNYNIIKRYTNIFIKNNIEIDIEVNQIKSGKYENDIEDKLDIDIGLIVLPIESKGAIETFLLESLSEKDEEKELVYQTREFIKNVKSEKYLKKRREKVKAELGVTFALISPDKVFTPLHNLLCEVNWGDYTTFQEGFKILENL